MLRVGYISLQLSPRVCLIFPQVTKQNALLVPCSSKACVWSVRFTVVWLQLWSNQVGKNSFCFYSSRDSHFHFWLYFFKPSYLSPQAYVAESPFFFFFALKNFYFCTHIISWNIPEYVWKRSNSGRAYEEENATRSLDSFLMFFSLFPPSVLKCVYTVLGSTTAQITCT